MIYMIIKEGTYRHEVKGLYHYLPKAINKAKTLMGAEHDDYHSFDIYSAPIEAPLEDVELVAIVSRRGKEIFVSRFDEKDKSHDLQTQSDSSL